MEQDSLSCKFERSQVLSVFVHHIGAHVLWGWALTMGLYMQHLVCYLRIYMIEPLENFATGFTTLRALLCRLPVNSFEAHVTALGRVCAQPLQASIHFAVGCWVISFWQLSIH